MTGDPSEVLAETPVCDKLTVEDKLRQMWEGLAMVTWYTRPLAIRAKSADEQLAWYRETLGKLAAEIKEPK